MGEVEAKATKTEKKQTVAQLLKFYVTFVAASVGGLIVNQSLMQYIYATIIKSDFIVYGH